MTKYKFICSATYLLAAFCRSHSKSSRAKIQRLPLLVAAPRGEHGLVFFVVYDVTITSF